MCTSRFGQFLCVFVLSLVLAACGGSSGSSGSTPNNSSLVSSSSSFSSASSVESSSSSSSSSSSVSSSSSANPVTSVVPISVSGNQLLFDGQAGSIAGPSLFWSNNGWGGEKYYTPEVVAWVKQDWNATLIRASMGVEDQGGYIQFPAANRAKVITVVDAAIANDMYVIIDWHSHRAENNQQAAIDFFTEMATLYGGYDNVIYEIYNEPLNPGQTGKPNSAAVWNEIIKPYAEAVIAAIRAVDPDNLIIVGTPTWSQDVDTAANSPITGYTNIAYALHFYAGTHRQYLRDKATTALNNGIALFVTEWGGVQATGDGEVDEGETLLWMDFIRQHNLSHANWALNDKSEGASALKPGTSVNGNWTDADLTPSGLLVKDIIKNW